MKALRFNHFWRMLGLLAVLMLAGNLTAQQMLPGYAVGTCQATGNDFVLGYVDVRAADNQVRDHNWYPPAGGIHPGTLPMYHHPDWTAANLGQVFGIALDNAGNVYVTST